MKYLLMIYLAENAISEGEREACYVKSTELARELAAKGQFVSANPLQPVGTARSVRVREGKRMVTDGPFAEAREYIGGYFLVDVDSEEEAVEIAGRIPGAKFGTVEVRPIVEIAGLPG